MSRTVFLVATPAGVVPVDDAADAEYLSRRGHRVTARTR